MILLGTVVFFIVPFLESAAQGLLCIFVPFYSLYYLITRWESMKRPFVLLLSANAGPIALAILLPAINASREAVFRAEQNQQAPVADVAVRAVPPPPRLPPPVGGISLVLNVSGVVDRQVASAMVRRIAEIALELNPRARQTKYVGRGNQLIFSFAPLGDPQAYADRINFGTVTSVQGGTIIVTVTPESAARVANAAPTASTPDPGPAPAPRPIGPRRFPRRPPMGGPRSR